MIDIFTIYWNHPDYGFGFQTIAYTPNGEGETRSLVGFGYSKEEGFWIELLWK